MIYNGSNHTWTMMYGTRNYRIHADLLRGATVEMLLSLDPETQETHRVILDTLVLTTSLMVESAHPQVVQFPDGKAVDMKTLLQIHGITPKTETKASRA